MNDETTQAGVGGQDDQPYYQNPLTLIDLQDRGVDGQIHRVSLSFDVPVHYWDQFKAQFGKPNTDVMLIPASAAAGINRNRSMAAGAGTGNQT